MSGRSLGCLIGALLLQLACSGPGLNVPEPDEPLRFELEGSNDPPQEVPPLFRGRLRGAAALGVPWLFTGELSSYYERSVRRSEIPKSLAQRSLPLRYWRDGADLLLQPLVDLELGGVYALALEGNGLVQTLRIGKAQPDRLARVFPPLGRRKYSSALFCGVGADEPMPELLLEPGELPLRPSPRLSQWGREDCLLLNAQHQPAEPVVSPPALGSRLLEAAPWLPPPTAERIAPPCAAGMPVRGACLEIGDDRILITPQVDDQLWLVEVPAARIVPARAATRVAIAQGLEAGSSLTLQAQVLSSSSGSLGVTVDLRTASARRHVVLNEVLANPKGAEASAEWIELTNDAETPASLAGLWLEDSGGRVPLPDVALGPHEFALLVGPGFRLGPPDVLVPSGTKMIELESLGARGLSNTGESLMLVGSEGVLSRFPALPAERAGRSWARRWLDATDDDPIAFAEHGGPGASPGAANQFDDDE